MKNYVKEGQKLPLFGIGPALIFSLGLVNVIFILLFVYVLKLGILSGVPALIFRSAGGVLIVLGIVVWFIGALKSDMDASITENRLKTDGMYAWVRNPMYSGWWMLLTGIALMWCNVFLIAAFFVNWGIMTVVLKNTEEKWLSNLYGEEYEAYKKRVNRCIPWKRK